MTLSGSPGTVIKPDVQQIAGDWAHRRAGWRNGELPRRNRLLEQESKAVHRAAPYPPATAFSWRSYRAPRPLLDVLRQVHGPDVECRNPSTLRLIPRSSPRGTPRQLSSYVARTTSGSTPRVSRTSVTSSPGPSSSQLNRRAAASCHRRFGKRRRPAGGG